MGKRRDHPLGPLNGIKGGLIVQLQLPHLMIVMLLHKAQLLSPALIFIRRYCVPLLSFLVLMRSFSRISLILSFLVFLQQANEEFVLKLLDLTYQSLANSRVISRSLC